MAILANTYSKLFSTFRRIEAEMRDAPRDGQQAELRTAARAIIRFQSENELPRLKQLVGEYGAALSAVKGAEQKLLKLESAISSHRSYIIGRFAANDTTSDAIELLGWELSAQLGAKAIDGLLARAAELEGELKAFVAKHKGVSDCLLVEQNEGWDKRTAESFDWLRREFLEQAKEAA